MTEESSQNKNIPAGTQEEDGDQEVINNLEILARVAALAHRNDQVVPVMSQSIKEESIPSTSTMNPQLYGPRPLTTATTAQYPQMVVPFFCVQQQPKCVFPQKGFKPFQDNEYFHSRGLAIVEKDLKVAAKGHLRKNHPLYGQLAHAAGWYSVSLDGARWLCHQCGIKEDGWYSVHHHVLGRRDKVENIPCPNCLLPCFSVKDPIGCIDCMKLVILFSREILCGNVYEVH